jgi:hypothetical protein
MLATHVPLHRSNPVSQTSLHSLLVQVELPFSTFVEQAWPQAPQFALLDVRS